MIHVLCIGDVVGGPGRLAVRKLLPELRRRHQLDLVIANGENAAGGVGLTPDTARDMFEAGVDVITGGNHLWKYRDLMPMLDSEPRLLRPLNYPEGAPGRGQGLFSTPAGVQVGVFNVQGRVFMDPVRCPFRASERAAAELRQQTPVVLVDMHAEATSEKRALGWHLDGKVSGFYGTHTHVATADEELLPEGTGYITDIGMTGPYDSVIGTRKEAVLQRFTTLRPTSFKVARGDVRLCGVVFGVDPTSGRCESVERVREPLQPGGGASS